MIFNSLEFLLFFPIVTVIYFIIPYKFRWGILLLASYYFYMSWNADLIYLILFTTILSYGGALLIEREKRKAAKRLIAALVLTLILGVLAFFKYFNFISHSITSVLNWAGASAGEVTWNLILPVGISFYTFQTLSYVLDVYRGSVKAERHFGYYALFVSFFPQLVAGPIERPENLIPQLRAYHKPNYDNLCWGMRMIAIGFFKKLMIADFAAPYVNAVYNNPQNATGLSIITATILFAFQIYGDFGGYTDIAIGCSRIMGIKLRKNFNRPYKAESIKEFWGKWHISLSSWFKDYLYIPLGGNRCSKIRNRMNLMIVFLVSGLWHGANWTYVCWGGIHGIYQVIGIAGRKLRDSFYKNLKISDKWIAVNRRIITFVLVCFAWIFFRANSMGDLLILIQALFTNWNISFSYVQQSFAFMNLTWLSAGSIFLAIAVMSMFDKEQAKLETGGKLHTKKGSMRYVYLTWAVILVWILLLSGNGTNQFIYFQF